jgi:hypothetical protein
MINYYFFLITDYLQASGQAAELRDALAAAAAAHEQQERATQALAIARLVFHMRFLPCFIRFVMNVERRTKNWNPKSSFWKTRSTLSEM